jgi:hypothetical protein
MGRRFDPPANSRSRSASIANRRDQANEARNKKLALYRQAIAERAEKARIDAEKKSAVPLRNTEAYLKALVEVPFIQLGRPEKLHPSAAYKQLVNIALKNLSDATRGAVLCWPNCAPSPAAIVAMLTLADCGAAAPLTCDGKDALAAPVGLRALIYPYARTTHRALRHIYVGKDYLAPLQLKHQVRCFRPNEDQALADYHKTLARVRTLTGKALDGREYAEFRNPCIDEIIPSGPCHGAEARSELLSRVRTKTDLVKISRTGLADDPTKARFYLFGLRANEGVEQSLKRVVGLDIVLLDLTSTGRNRLGKDWLPRIRAFLTGLDARFGSTAVLALTDDPWTFDAMRFDALLKEPKRKRGNTPAPSNVIFAQLPDIVVSNDSPPATYTAVKHQEVIGFAGESEATMQALRAARNAALELNDGENVERLGALMGVVGRCLSLPASRTALGEFIEQERGSLAAADMMAVYRVGTVIRDIKQSNGPWAQTARPALLEICQRVEKLTENTNHLSPMAPLLRDVLARFLHNSSKTAVMFQKDMLAEFAEYALAQDEEIGKDIERRLEIRMLQFVDRAGLDDLEGLSLSERNSIKTLIVVAPTRAVMMPLLARSWLPDNLIVLGGTDMLANAARDASRLAQYPELAPLKSRMERFVANASDAVRRVTNSSVDLNHKIEPIEDAVLPPSGIVNLAGNVQADQALVRLELDGGQTILAKPGTKLVIQDTSHTIPLFAEEEARNVETGDRVCVIGEAFLEMARPLLNITARAAEEIRDYHELVLKRFEALPGKNTAERLAILVEKMAVPGVTTATANYWIDLKPQLEVPLHDVVPHAPRHFATFLPFMSALSVSEAIAKRYWTWAVIAQRTNRMRAANTFHDAYRSILVDSYAAQSDNPERARDVRQLRAAAENFVSVVQAKKELRGNHAGA